jgi:hypothetical protein
VARISSKLGFLNTTKLRDIDFGWTPLNFCSQKYVINFYLWYCSNYLLREREGERGERDTPFHYGTEKYLSVRNSDIFRAHEYFKLRTTINSVICGLYHIKLIVC